MKALYKNPIAIIYTVLAIVGFIYFEKQLPSVDLSHLESGNVIAVLGYLSVIMLVVEQFIEIFLDDPSEKIKMKSKTRIAHIDEYLNKIYIPKDSAISVADKEEVIQLTKEKQELKNVLITHAIKRKQRTTIIAFLIGLTLSFSGIRLISGIILNTPDAQISEIQVTIIKSIDIVLTAGIIAGGSNRVHRLIKRIKEALGTSSV